MRVRSASWRLADPAEWHDTLCIAPDNFVIAAAAMPHRADAGALHPDHAYPY